MKKKNLSLALLSIIFFAADNIMAQISNDYCANAVTLTSGTICNYTTGNSTGATQTIAPITCNTSTGNADDDVWYQFTAVQTSHIVQVQSGADFDAVVEILTSA